MNTTRNISMGGYAFIVEEDAYERLKNYTDAVRRNLAGSPGFEEMMADIEGGIAEILRESKAGREVVNLEDVNTVIRRMGEPEVYVQDDNGAAKKAAADQPETDDVPGTRRLHRDGENKIVGGVCAGLGAYAGIDPVWFRLAFAVALVFYGTGIWLYIILWVIMPEAKTRLQKLQMRGKRPDLKNIEDSIRSELGDVGKNIDKIANDKSVREGAKRAGDAAGDLFSALFKLLGKILELALKVFAGVVAVTSLLFLGVLIFALITGTYSINVSDRGEINVENVVSVIPHLFENGTEGWMFYTFIFLFLVIPTVALLANSIRYLANISTKTPKWVSILAVCVWVLALAGLLYSGIRLSWDFTQQATGKSEKTFNLPQGQTLNIRMVEEENGTLPGYLMGNVWFDVRETKDSLFTLRVFREASGRTYSDADRRQQVIVYEPQLQDSVLLLPRLFRLPEGEVIREQTITMELHVPHNRRIYLEPGMEVLLNDVDNVQNEHDSRMAGQYWIMTDKGLSCEGCPIPAPDSTDTE